MNAVAKGAGLSHSMVSRVEHELRKPTLDTLLRMAGAMGIELWPIIQKSEAALPVRKMKVPAGRN
jgi:transcriptional regulator with XRE-family HTH domain